MNDCVNKLIAMLSDGFTRLDECEKEYNIKNDNLNKYENLLSFIRSDAKKLNKYDDQTLIHDAVLKNNSSIKEYDAACYLLDSNDENVSLIPQYRNSKIYLDTIINCLKMTRDELKQTVLELENECNTMNRNKKYYTILSEDKPLVADINEFVSLLDDLEIGNEDKKTIISYIIKSNVSNYKKKN